MNSKQPFIPVGETDKYVVSEPISEKEIMEMAKYLVSKRFQRGEVLKCPLDSKDYLSVKMSEYEHEVFGVIYLDNRHAILEVELLFRGTIDGASVYPREVVKQILKHNAAAVILFHNHPSGVAEPSSSDIRLTTRLIKALETIDVRVIDHMVVGGNEVVSFAERGLL